LYVQFRKFRKLEPLHTTYYVAIDGVHLDTDKFPIAFGPYEICRLTDQKFREIFYNDTNAIFYPQILKFLDEFRYVPFVRVPAIRKFHSPGPDPHEVEPQRYIFNESVDYVLALLVLYPWELRKVETDTPPVDEGNNSCRFLNEWTGFSCPTILQEPEDLFRKPVELSDDKPPALNPGIVETETLDYYINNHVMIGDEIDSLKNFLSSAETKVRNFEKYKEKWQFIHIAHKMLLKAFFSNGIDQLIWHITAIEAMVGQKADGNLTSTVARRISAITGKKEYYDIFKRLYETRCNFIHGNIMPKKVYISDLYSARLLARQTLVWFINFMNKISESFQDHEKAPTREAILKFIDLDRNERMTQQHLNTILGLDFPNNPDWINRL
jgi:hypothetical protein